MSKELNDDDFYSADSRKECSCGRVFTGRFCPKCGKEYVYEVRCPKCGMMNSGSDNFCSECGAKLDNNPKKEKAPKEKAPKKEKAPLSKRVKALLSKIGKKRLIIIGSSVLSVVVIAVALSILIPYFYRSSFEAIFGDTMAEVIEVYGEPDNTYLTGGSAWFEYYGDEYFEIVERLESAPAGQLAAVEDAVRNIEYSYMTVHFDEYSRVDKVTYDTSATYFQRYSQKEAKGNIEVLSKSVETRYGVYWDIVFVSRYTDGSYIIASLEEAEGIKIDGKTMCKWWDNWTNEYREIIVD